MALDFSLSWIVAVYIPSCSTGDIGSLSRYPSVEWRQYDTSGSLDGDSVSCRYTFYYDYWTNTYIDPTYTTYANVKFTGYYSNGAVATNVNANHINFNGEVYP